MSLGWIIIAKRGSTALKSLEVLQTLNPNKYEERDIEDTEMLFDKRQPNQVTSSSLIPVSMLLFHHRSVLNTSNCTMDTTTMSNSAPSVSCHTCNKDLFCQFVCLEPQHEELLTCKKGTAFLQGLSWSVWLVIYFWKTAFGIPRWTDSFWDKHS